MSNSGVNTIEIIAEFSKRPLAYKSDYKSLNKLIYDLSKENGLEDIKAIPQISETEYKDLEKEYSRMDNENIGLSFTSFKVEYLDLKQEPFSFTTYIEHLKERY